MRAVLVKTLAVARTSKNRFVGGIIASAGRAQIAGSLGTPTPGACFAFRGFMAEARRVSKHKRRALTRLRRLTFGDACSVGGGGGRGRTQMGHSYRLCADDLCFALAPGVHPQ